MAPDFKEYTTVLPLLKHNSINKTRVNIYLILCTLSIKTKDQREISPHTSSSTVCPTTLRARLNCESQKKCCNLSVTIIAFHLHWFSDNSHLWRHNLVEWVPFWQVRFNWVFIYKVHKIETMCFSKSRKFTLKVRLWICVVVR